jgi:hypothetical protein
VQKTHLGVGLVLDQFGLVVMGGPAVIGGEVDHIAFAQAVGGDDL